MKHNNKSILDEGELSSNQHNFDENTALKASFFEKIHQTKNNIFSFIVRSVFILLFSAFFFVVAIYYGLINP